MRLFQASYLLGSIGIHPSIAHFPGLRNPKIHAPWQGNGRIGVAGGKLIARLCAHKRTHIVYRKGLFATSCLSHGTAQEAKKESNKCSFEGRLHCVEIVFLGFVGTKIV